eukprot:Protomagalhaensia_sp_Gyna_25__4810@NODE_490_length_3284_cov_1179_605547_g381_i0_p5_GENE_NODE_490_length_3284_cov_1179_605547_g381_i0NODE_490_length_3284_cov_1179_605547_g381_i0_p5_ORF_typecomplete_len100_score14_23_NODE_490_length_3284_cov_1179_605547_g381_i01300
MKIQKSSDRQNFPFPHSAIRLLTHCWARMLGGQKTLAAIEPLVWENGTAHRVAKPTSVDILAVMSTVYRASATFPSTFQEYTLQVDSPHEAHEIKENEV